MRVAVDPSSVAATAEGGGNETHTETSIEDLRTESLYVSIVICVRPGGTVENSPAFQRRVEA